jgi:hypothetical protein
MAGTSGKGGKGGSSGHATNAALDDNEDLIKVRRGKHFREWASKRRKGGPRTNDAPADMAYPNSPKPPSRKFGT